MNISHLSLANFRNFSSLELELPPGIAIFHGGNAQGKSNLLEAIYFLATSRSLRAESDTELINKAAPEPCLRLYGRVERGQDRVELEVSVATWAGGGTRKRIRVNGIPRRASDLVGRLNVVIFTPEDIELIYGAPTLRRRYLDITCSQVDHRYLRALQRYTKVLTQRNSLLRLIGEGQARASELGFWNGELVGNGAYLMAQRQALVGALGELARTVHSNLTAAEELLEICYIPSLPLGLEAPLEAIEATFATALEAGQDREIAQGMTLVGPHRDDLRFLVNGLDMDSFGSRGQQRTIALALKLAEASLMRSRVGEPPVLLLDDVLSELDSRRRVQLLGSLQGDEQVLITATDLDHFLPDFVARASLFKISQGRVEAVSVN
ncbi:MAG TPA: DNA replication/repair protein RecF [Dehalococcoidia bacterium]|nr:DNA replication/repair protein RecF [Dehalococcoidia bacterium]